MKRTKSARPRLPGRVPRPRGPRSPSWSARVLLARKAPLLYLVRFALLAGAELTAYYFPYDPRGFAAALLRFYLASYARLAGAALSVFDPTVHVIGTEIFGRFRLSFAMSCDAMDVFLLFSSAVIAFPSSFRHRAWGVVAGLVALVALNIARITSLYWLGVRFPAAFDFCHVDVWPFLIVAVTCGGFLGWARSTRPGPNGVLRASQA